MPQPVSSVRAPVFGKRRRDELVAGSVRAPDALGCAVMDLWRIGPDGLDVVLTRAHEGGSV